MIDIQEAVRTILKLRRENLRPVEEALAKADGLLETLTLFRSAAGEAGDPLTAEAVEGIKTFPVEAAIASARDARLALERAALRLRRDCVNIGVAGRARQGKSTFLKAFSGLGDDAVPTGGEGFCTAARSEIRNSATPGVQVLLHTRDSFFTETIVPYYLQLDLSPVPGNLDEFLFNEIPPLIEGGDVSRSNLYKVLHGIRANIGKVMHLMLGGSKGIGQEEIRDYVTKDKGNWNYLAVRKAVIDATFPHPGLPRELRLIDLPGLGELALNIEQELTKSVADLADIVLIVRMPQAQGDGWGDKDMETINLVRNALPDLDPRHWLALVLNHSVSRIHDNTVNVDNMLNQARAFDLGGISIWICDCSNAGEVREKVIMPAMGLLARHAGALDRKRLDIARKSLDGPEALLAAPLRTLKAALALHDPDSRDAIVEENGDQFITELRDNLRIFLSDLRPGVAKGREEIAAGIVDEVKRMIADIFPVLRGGAFPATYKVWNKEAISRKLKNLQGGFPGVRNLSATNTRVALTRFISSRLDSFFQTYNHKLKRGILEAVTAIEPMSKLVPAMDDSGMDAGLLALADALAGQAPILSNAFRRFSQLSFTYDINFYPDVRDYLRPLDPDDGEIFNSPDGIGNMASTKGGTTSFDADAAHIRAALDTTSVKILTEISKRARDLPVHLEKTIFAAAEELFDQILWSDEAEREWKRVLHGRRRELWADRYARLDARDKAVAAWRQRLGDVERSASELAAANL